jgi:beta-N-acetylhexosaminidase
MGTGRAVTDRQMNGSLEQLAHAVLLPAVTDLDVAVLEPLVGRGCRCVLLGETRAEYLARAMSEERTERESEAFVAEAVSELRTASSNKLLVAVDHEVVGIRRFRHLTPAEPEPDETTTPTMVENAAATAGRHLAALGIDVVLGPIVDVVRGPNPWLEGRNLGPNAARVAAIGRAAVRGLQSAGIAAVAKHYPGHAVVQNDPAVTLAQVTTEVNDLDVVDEEPFAAVVAAGVRGLMLGPAVVDAIDPEEAASCSAAVAARARRRLGFRGTLVSDDLDAVSILRGRDIASVASSSLSAGLDLLLVPAAAAAACAAGIADAVIDGRLSADRVTQAAARVEALGGRQAT